MNLETLQAKKIGLILSGGGVRGMAHIGLIKALKEFNLSADVVAGSSVGALVAGLYANGKSTDEMLHFFEDTPLFKYSFFTINKAGFLDTVKYIELFKTYFPDNSFEALQKKLFVVATNLELGEEKMFSSGELIRPLLASAALPPVFSPVEIGEFLYADGGIMNNFPKEYVDPLVNFTIGSNVSIAGEIGKKDVKNPIQMAARVTGLMIYASSKKKVQECDLAISPKALESIGLLDKKGIKKAYEIGYSETMKSLESLFKLS